MPLTIKDALRLATKDQAFANELVSNPDSLRAHFGLSDAQVNQLKNLGAAAAAAAQGIGIGAKRSTPEYH
jgi:hypothetical protein